MINSTVTVLSPGLMVLGMKASISKVKKKEKVVLLLQMEAIMKANSVKMKSVALVIISGPMENLTAAIGAKTKWTAKVHFHGKMERSMMEIS